MKRWLVIGGAGLLVAWAPFIYAELMGDDEPGAAPSTSASAAFEDLEEEEEVAEEEPSTEEVPAEQDKPAEQAEEPGNEEAPPENQEPGPEDTAEEGEPEAEADDEEHQEGQAVSTPNPKVAAMGPVAQLKEAFDNEPRDSLWAADEEPRLSQLLLDNEIAEDYIDAVKCQRTVCRLDLTWPAEDTELHMTLFNLVRQEFGFETGFEPREQDDEHKSFAIYVLRKGYTVKDLE